MDWGYIKCFIYMLPPFFAMHPDTQETRKKIGHRIKVRRVELDLKQSELGDLVGATQAHISEWEIGRRALRIEQALILAKALKTTVGYLVGESETRNAA
jgi:transcriptional regulator with XRE-family HTH domain